MKKVKLNCVRSGYLLVFSLPLPSSQLWWGTPSDHLLSNFSVLFLFAFWLTKKKNFVLSLHCVLCT